MDQLIIYGSQYGTTGRYAMKFSEMTHCPCMGYGKVKNPLALLIGTQIPYGYSQCFAGRDLAGTSGCGRQNVFKSYY